MMTILSETDWVRNDKWTVLMEAASFGQAEVIIINVFILIVILIIILIIINGHIYHVQVVSVLLERPGLELEAVNVRGQIWLIISHYVQYNIQYIQYFQNIRYIHYIQYIHYMQYIFCIFRIFGRYQIIVLFITGQTAMEVAQARGHLQVELMLLKMMMMRRKVMMMMMVIMMRKMKMMIAQVSELIKSSLEQRDKPDEV